MKETLQLAKGILDQHPPQAEKGLVKTKIENMLSLCESNAKTLRDIFEAFEKDVDKEKGSSTWEKIRRRYLSVVVQRIKQYKSKDTVELVMERLLRAVHTLANYQIFRDASERKSLLNKMNELIDKLESIQWEDPTLEEDELEGASGSTGQSNTQNNYGDGQANQNNPLGGQNTFNMAGRDTNYHSKSGLSQEAQDPSRPVS